MPMSPLLVFVSQVARFLVMAALGYLEAKGVITANVGNGVADFFINALVVAVSFLGFWAWHKWELWRQGLTVNSPHPPANFPGMAATPKSMNAPDIDARNLPPQPPLTPPTKSPK
jgi:hypothetical protein